MASDSAPSIGQPGRQRSRASLVVVVGLVAAVLALGWTLVTWLVLVMQTPTSSQFAVSSIDVVLAALATVAAALGYGLRVTALSWTALVVTICLALFLGLAWTPPLGPVTTVGPTYSGRG